MKTDVKQQFWICGSKRLLVSHKCYSLSYSAITFSRIVWDSCDHLRLLLFVMKVKTSRGLIERLLDTQGLVVQRIQSVEVASLCNCNNISGHLMPVFPFQTKQILRGGLPSILWHSSNWVDICTVLQMLSAFICLFKIESNSNHYLTLTLIQKCVDLALGFFI